MRARNDGIDSKARVYAARDILAALPGIWTKSLTEDIRAPRRACTPLHPSRPIVAISMVLPFAYTATTAMGKVDIVERTIGLHEDLPARAADVFELGHEPLQNAVG